MLKINLYSPWLKVECSVILWPQKLDISQNLLWHKKQDLSRRTESWSTRQCNRQLMAQVCDPRLPASPGDLLLFMLHTLPAVGNRLLWIQKVVLLKCGRQPDAIELKINPYRCLFLYGLNYLDLEKTQTRNVTNWKKSRQCIVQKSVGRWKWVEREDTLQENSAAVSLGTSLTRRIFL